MEVPSTLSAVAYSWIPVQHRCPSGNRSYGWVLDMEQGATTVYGLATWPLLYPLQFLRPTSTKIRFKHWLIKRIKLRQLNFNSSNNCFKLFEAFRVVVLEGWVGFGFHFLVDGIVFFHDGLWDSDSFPFGATVVHSVHHFSVLSNIFGVGVWAVPVWELGLFAHFSFSFDQFAVSQDISTSVI